MENLVKLNPDAKMQIDVVKIEDNHVVCNLYTEHVCAKIMMSKSDYELMVHRKFFIRDGKTQDSSKVWNTTEEYRLPVKKKGY